MTLRPWPFQAKASVRARGSSRRYTDDGTEKIEVHMVESKFQDKHGMEDVCLCDAPKVWKLMWALTPNPICCMRCNLEISPSESHITADLENSISTWISQWSPLYKTWLGSGEDETLATNELINIESEPNKKGREIVKELSKINPCYYQVFEEEILEGWTPMRVCPSCSKLLQPRNFGKFKYQSCEDCGLLYWGAEEK